MGWLRSNTSVGNDMLIVSWVANRERRRVFWDVEVVKKVVVVRRPCKIMERVVWSQMHKMMALQQGLWKDMGRKRCIERTYVV
jgi:hypothetical protein